MITMIVTHAGVGNTPFSGTHWVNVQLPILRQSWGPYGLISVASFSPPADGTGVIATVIFRNEEAMHAALRSPEAQRVMADADLVALVSRSANSHSRSRVFPHRCPGTAAQPSLFGPARDHRSSI